MTQLILSIPLNELISEITRGTMHFMEELMEKSRIDEENEELLGMDNIIKMVALERKLKEKDKLIKEKDKEIQRLKAQLKKK